MQYFNEEQKKDLLQTEKSDYSSKNRVLIRHLSGSDEKLNTEISEGWNPLSPLSIEGETEAERLLSSRCGSYASGSARTVDSMTNVTRLTVSSLDLSSSTSSSDSFSSLSSVNSSLSSVESEEDYQHQWNVLWKKHYKEEYLEQYNKFIKSMVDIANLGKKFKIIIVYPLVAIIYKYTRLIENFSMKMKECINNCKQTFRTFF